MRFIPLLSGRRKAAWLLLGACLGLAPLPAKSGYRELVAPDTVQRDLKGPVKSVTEKTFRRGDDGKPVLQREKITRYDREGYQVLELTTDVAESSRVTEQRIYDENLDLARVETHDGRSLDTRVVKTDLAKKLVTWRIRDGFGRLTLAKEMIYGAARKPVEGREYDAMGRLVQGLRVTRNARGLGTEVLFLDPKARVKYRSVPAWDERDFMIGSVDEFLEKGSTAVRTFEPGAVDAAGNWTELRKGGKFLEKDGEHPAPPEFVGRLIEYWTPGS